MAKPMGIPWGNLDMNFEYMVVPTPKKAKSARGVKGGSAKFAHAMTSLMNEMAADGWQYQRADTLPMEERQGLTKKTVNYHSLLVFRRPVQIVERQQPVVAAPPVQDPEPVEYVDRLTEPEEIEQAQVYAEEPLETYAETERRNRDMAAE